MATTVIASKSTTLAATEQNLILTEVTDTQDFENFTPGPITNGENDWVELSSHDQ